MKTSTLAKRLVSQHKGSETEDLTMKKRKKRIQLAGWTEQGEMELIEVFEPVELFQGTRRSHQEGQAIKRFKEVEKHPQGSERGQSFQQPRPGERREKWEPESRHDPHPTAIH